MTRQEKAREQRCRRLAISCGLVLQKARRHDAWGYQLWDPRGGYPVYADWARETGYGLSLEDVEAWFAEEDGEPGEQAGAQSARQG